MRDRILREKFKKRDGQQVSFSPIKIARKLKELSTKSQFNDFPTEPDFENRRSLAYLIGLFSFAVLGVALLSRSVLDPEASSPHGKRPQTCGNNIGSQVVY